MDSSTGVQHAIAIETLFRDAYRILHEIQQAPERVTSLGGSLFHCHREIKYLERIHSNQSRIFGRDPLEDTLGLRGALDKFMTSCNALTYIVSYDQLDAEVGHGLCLFPSKRGGKEKQKQIRALEDDFANHERTLSMTVAHAVYTSTLEMQRLNETHDSSLAIILRRSERRHTAFERFDPEDREDVQQKKAESRTEEEDWELCLRRYFEHVDTWTPPQSNVEEAPQALRRSSSHSQFPGGQPLQRRLTNESIASAYGDYRRGEEEDTNRYYRKPRPRSISQQSLHRQSLPDLLVRRRYSNQSLISNPSNALVVYGSDLPPSTTTSSVIARRASFTGDFPWECLANRANLGILAPLMARYPDLKQAHGDICTETTSMTASEARAYAQGRLAGLGPDVANELKSALASGQKSRGSVNMLDQRRQSVHQDWKVPANIQARPPNQMSWKQPKAIAAAPHSNSQSKGVIPRAQTLPPKASHLQQSNNSRPTKHRFFSMTDLRQELRPLTAISERSRPGTARSKASSLDKSSGRSIMQTFKSKKSNLSMEILEVIPDRESQSKGSNSTGSATLTSNKDLDLVVPDIVIEEKRIIKSPTPMKSAMKKALNLDKPLPPKPQVSISSKTSIPSQPSITKTPASPKSAKLPGLPKSFDSKPNLLKLFGKPPSLSKKSRSRLPIRPSVVSLHSQLSSMNHSKDSLSVRRVSVDLLRRKDSKMTLISVAEGLELPFDMWLRALPYIEGRVGTPRN